MGATRRLAWLEAKLLLREPTTLVFTLAFPLIMLFVLAEVFGNSTADRDEVVFRGLGAIDYYVPAYVALVGAGVGLVSLPVHVASYREHGIYRRFRASGLSAATVLGAEIAVAVALTLLASGLVVAATAGVYRNREPSSPAAVAGVLLLVALTFAALGVMLGVVLPNTRAAQGAGSMLFFVSMVLSGAGPPPEVLSSPLHAISQVLPLTHAIRIVQDPWLGFGFEWGALAVVVGFLAGSAALAARRF